MRLPELLPRILKPEAIAAMLSVLRRKADQDVDQVARRLDGLSGHTQRRLPQRGYFKG